MGLELSPYYPDYHQFWWKAKDPNEGWERVFKYVRGLEETQKYIHELNIRNARLYANTDMLGFDWTLATRDYSRRNYSQVSENVIESVVDTAHSMMGKNRPRVVFTTDGANFSTQRRARLLEKFIEAQFHKTKVYDHGADAFRDGCVFGTGPMKIIDAEDHIEVEHTLVDEIVVDETECRSGMPRQIHHRKFVDREVLKAAWPEFTEEIENSNLADDQRIYTSYRKIPVNQICVIESWHLPSGPDAKDGHHSICIEGASLLWEKWEKSYFPFVFYRWSKPIAGFYGKGLAQQLTGLQLNINKLNRFISQCQDMISAPRIFVDVASKILKAHFTNEIGAIIPYRGKAPIFMTPQAVAPEIYQYKETLKRSAFEFAGISQLSAQSKKPVGLESAVALREYNDIETQRFAIQAQRYEGMYLEIAAMMIDIAKDIAARGHDMMAIYHGRHSVEKIHWKDVDLERDCYAMSVEAASILSRSPAGRMQEVVELSNSGWITPEEGRRLTGHPDLQRSWDLDTAGIENIERTIENLLDGKFRAPEPFQNLQMGMKMVLEAYLKAWDDDAPERILEGMRQWMEQAKFLLTPPPQPGVPAPDTGSSLQAQGTPKPAVSQQAQMLRPIG